MMKQEHSTDLVQEVKDLLVCNKVDSNLMADNDSDSFSASCPTCIACTCMICV
ncbi:hypothetical protein LXJ15735_15210 [Lacrimispora xylanolytica]|uniref:hypothetical protein n=1 Tax=Clostridium sp. 12(A) TaxID=1163671 RepID=UPI0004BBFEFB|nr:hypothetical protein [Clostridium sp. 12(A)]